MKCIFEDTPTVHQEWDVNFSHLYCFYFMFNGDKEEEAPLWMDCVDGFNHLYSTLTSINSFHSKHVK